MLHRITFALVVAAFVVPLSARNAEPDEFLWDSGNAFLATCRALEKSTSDLTSPELVAVNNCISFVNGVDEGIRVEIVLLNESGHPQLLPFCVPSGVKRGQPPLVLLKYIRDNPAKAHEATGILYARAMQDAFPCPTH